MTEADPQDPYAAFPDDLWEYPYAANRAFDTAVYIQKRLDVLGEAHPDAADMRARLQTAKADFAGYNRAFDADAGEAQHNDFVLHSEDDPSAIFTGVFHGTVRTSQIPELRRLFANFGRQLGELATGMVSETSVAGESRSVPELLFDSETLINLQTPLHAIYDKYTKDPETKSTAAHGRNALLNEGLKTFRDMLVLGQDKAADVRNFGANNQALAEKIVEEHGFQSIWQEADQMTRAAKLYNSIDEIPCYIASTRHVGGLKYRTVGQILSMDLRDIIRTIGDNDKDAQGRTERLFGQFIKFETAFNRSRLRLLRRYGGINLPQTKED